MYTPSVVEPDYNGPTFVKVLKRNANLLRSLPYSACT